MAATSVPLGMAVPDADLDSIMYISSSEDFRRGLDSPQVSVLVLMGDVMLSEQSWMGADGKEAPLVDIGRNITIRGSVPYVPNPEGLLSTRIPLLDCAYVTQRYRMLRGVHLFMQDLAVIRCYPNVGFNQMLFAASPGSTVHYINGLSLRTACLQFNQSVANSKRWPRQAPGVNRIRTLTNTSFCYTGSSLPAWEHFCYDKIIIFDDVVTDVPEDYQVAPTGGGFGGYQVDYKNLWYGCRIQAPWSCASQAVPLSCIDTLEADWWAAQAQNQSVPPSGGGSGDSNDDNLAVVIPAVVVPVVAVLVLAGLAFLWLRRRQLQQQQQQAPAAKLLEDEESAARPADKSATDCGGAGNGTASDALPATEASPKAVLAALHPSQGTMTNTMFEKRSTEMTPAAVEQMRKTLAQGMAFVDIIKEIKITSRLGWGSYGQVFKGLWSGMPVAIKTMTIPAIGGANAGLRHLKEQQRVLMEAAISSSISHPNVVQTYTYSIAPVSGGPRTASSASLANRPIIEDAENALFFGHQELPSAALGCTNTDLSTNANLHDAVLTAETLAWEVRLVLEFCDRGNLRDLIDSGALHHGVPEPPTSSSSTAHQQQQQGERGATAAPITITTSSSVGGAALVSGAARRAPTSAPGLTRGDAPYALAEAEAEAEAAAGGAAPAAHVETHMGITAPGSIAAAGGNAATPQQLAAAATDVSASSGNAALRGAYKDSLAGPSSGANACTGAGTPAPNSSSLMRQHQHLMMQQATASGAAASNSGPGTGMGMGMGGPGGVPDLLAIVVLAMDVARGMAHLHTCNILHLDLKCRNVLLKSSAISSTAHEGTLAPAGWTLRQVADSIDYHPLTLQHAATDTGTAAPGHAPPSGATTSAAVATAPLRADIGSAPIPSLAPPSGPLTSTPLPPAASLPISAPFSGSQHHSGHLLTPRFRNQHTLGLVAKVADFGLSMLIQPHETHISNVCQGTTSHMAPEVMLEGRVAKAADVYAFGVLLWELITGGHAFKGMPAAVMTHRVCIEGYRPPLPVHCPAKLASLVHDCWAQDSGTRPTFTVILHRLHSIKSELACAIPSAVMQSNSSAPTSAVSNIVEGLGAIAAAGEQHGSGGPMKEL